jgi:hypothetical protein
MFHGAIATAFALDRSFWKGVKAFHSAVVMRWAGRYHQWVFALSRNPHLPKHVTYAQLWPAQAKRMHDAILGRLR